MAETETDELLVPIGVSLTKTGDWIARVREIAKEFKIPISLPEGTRGRWNRGTFYQDDLGLLTDAMNKALDKADEGIYFDPARGLCEETR